MAKPGLFAREAAVRLLHSVLLERRLLIDLVNGEDSPLIDLEPNERARAQSLTLTTLRNLGPIDTVLERFLTKQTPFALLNILRVAATEILVDGIADHAAVDAAVTMAKRKQKTAHLKNLANAVLRKVASEGPEIFAALPPQELPKAFRSQMAKIMSKEDMVAIERAHQKGARVDLSFKDSEQAKALAERLNADVMSNGSVRLHRAGQISELPGFADGDWWVQDAAASIPAKCFGDLRGKRVLDLCAAPGGKTMQLAAMGADVTALDVSAQRMERVKQNLGRTKLTAECVVADALKWAPDAPFDAILLDAPCSATGTIRRHPDLPFAKANFDLRDLLTLQRDLILKASEWLSPNGILIYSTCSIFAAEGEGQTKWLSKQESVLEPSPIDPISLGLDSTMANAEGQIRLRPDFWEDQGGMDGFFVAKFTRKA
jgi:16S rRNA (cytosine967-C5)-methyltransferase